MPTFIILKGKDKIEQVKDVVRGCLLFWRKLILIIQVSGGSPPALIAFLKKHAPASAAASSSGSGSVPEKGLEGFVRNRRYNEEQETTLTLNQHRVLSNL